MDDMNRWLCDRKARGLTMRGRGMEGPALLAFQEMVGKQFGTLRVLEYAGLLMRPDGTGSKDRQWRCECACSTANRRVELVVRESFLKRGYVKSCGLCSRATAHEWPERILRKLMLALECEGAIGVYDTGPRMIIAVRDYAVGLVDEVLAMAGIGNVTAFKKGDGTPMVQWQVSGFDALALAKALRPFAICKGAQTDAVIAYPIGNRRVRVTAEVRAERRRLSLLTLILNRRGPADAKPEWAEAAQQWGDWAQHAGGALRAEMLASAIEWEGNIAIRERACASATFGASHGVAIWVSQADQRRALLDVCQSLAGGRGAVGAPKADARHPDHSLMSRWGVASIREVKELAAELVPYMKYKKRLAEMVLEFPEWDFAPTPIPHDLFFKRRALAAEAKEINKDIPVEEEHELAAPEDAGEVLERPVVPLPKIGGK